jgi:hypothetical protein
LLACSAGGLSRIPGFGHAGAAGRGAAFGRRAVQGRPPAATGSGATAGQAAGRIEPPVKPTTLNQIDGRRPDSPVLRGKAKKPATDTCRHRPRRGRTSSARPRGDVS